MKKVPQQAGLFSFNDLFNSSTLTLSNQFTDLQLYLSVC
jgi:hypothetical protein